MRSVDNDSMRKLSSVETKNSSGSNCQTRPKNSSRTLGEGELGLRQTTAAAYKAAAVKFNKIMAKGVDIENVLPLHGEDERNLTMG